jgi:hypothetical protein
MNIDDSFPSPFLKAADLGGAELLLIIKTVQPEPVGRSRELKPVIYFYDRAKGLVLNRTNARAITAITNSKDTNTWPGTKVVLYPTLTEFAGETVQAIRVKAAADTSAKKGSTTKSDDEDDVSF